MVTAAELVSLLIHSVVCLHLVVLDQMLSTDIWLMLYINKPGGTIELVLH